MNLPALAHSVRITPWVDPVIDTLGFDPRSFYCEKFWLPALALRRTYRNPRGTAIAATRVRAQLRPPYLPDSG
jgi:hypothetical protein